MAKMNCGLVYSTRLQISDFEAWLNANYRGDCRPTATSSGNFSSALKKTASQILRPP